MFNKLNQYFIKLYNQYSDQDLLIQIKEGSTEAFEALYYRHFATMYRTAYKRIRREDVIDELVQDVFINLWLKRGTLDRNGDIVAYLFATLRNKILHELRREMIHVRNLQKMQHDTIAKIADDCSDFLAAKETERKIQLVLQGLSPKSREAFTLSRFDNLSYKSIAKQMNISVNTVEKHISKALALIRKRI